MFEGYSSGPGTVIARYGAGVTFEEAMTLLGLDLRNADPTVVRSAYLAAIRQSHPDRNPSPGATHASAQLTVAYRVVVETLATRPRPASRSTGPPVAPDPPAPDPVSITEDVTIIADDTIEVAAPPDVAFAWLVHTGHIVGDVTFLDRSAALLQVLVAFVDEPICQMIFDLQGRAARGTTEIFCTIESIDDRPAPPIDDVTAFIATELATVARNW